MPTLSASWMKFLVLPHKFCSFVAGFDSGKTWVDCPGLTQHVWEWPCIDAGYLAPIYAQIRGTFYPIMEEVTFDWGLWTKVSQVNHGVHFYNDSAYRAMIICHSMKKPQTTVGFKADHALSDEIDALPARKIQQAWRRIAARMRYKADGLHNCVDVTTTSESFKFAFQQFVKQLREKPHLQDLYGLVQASTYDNEASLPDDHIDSLMESCPPQLITTYPRDQFVNLISGIIHTACDRTLSASQETVQLDESIFVDMDFNVGKIAAAMHMRRLGLLHAVDETVNRYNAPNMIRQIKERFWLYADGEYRPTRQIRIYPDALDDFRRSAQASETDIALLEQAGFVISASIANPPAKGRVNFMNAMFCNTKGERRCRVNPDRRPTYADALEQQVRGIDDEPDKLSDIDHPNDASGYFIHKEYPITKYSLAGVS